MEVVYERCAGLDIHKRVIAACIVISGSGKQPRKEVRTFGTTTGELLGLADWLIVAGVSHVAMESTGVYWKPAFNLLEGSFTLLLANARHIKAVPGRKTDVKDCEWIAELLRHGLIQASFVPDRPQRELRELTRYRTTLVRERTAEVNRLQKTLEGANIKLASVASTIMGKSAREMIEALVAGSSDVAAMARLARGRLRTKLPQLEDALRGSLGPHQRFLLKEQLAHLDFLDAAIQRASAEIVERVRPFEATIANLRTIPGVGQQTGEALVAEIGADVQRFPSARHLASWAGICPGNHESGGKRMSGKTRRGSPWLRAALVEAAHAAGRTKNTYLAAQFRRLLPRRGKKKATIAVAHSILVIAYHVISRGTTYRDLGYLYFEQRDRNALQRRLTSRLERLGYRVTLEPAAA